MSHILYMLGLTASLLAIIGGCVLLSNLSYFRWYRKFIGGKWRHTKSIFGDWYWERIEQETVEDYTTPEQE